MSSPGGANLPRRDPHRPRVELPHIRNSETGCQELNPKSTQHESRTQNDVRGASAPARQNHLVTDLKSPKLPILLEAARNATISIAPALSCCRTNMGRQYGDSRGDPHSSPHIPVTASEAADPPPPPPRPGPANRPQPLDLANPSDVMAELDPAIHVLGPIPGSR